MATIDTSLFPSANVRFQMAELPSGPNIDPLAIQQQKLANQTAAQNLETAKRNQQKAKLTDAIREVVRMNTPEEAHAAIDRHVANGDMTPEQAADAKSKVPTRAADGSIDKAQWNQWIDDNMNDYLATNEQLYAQQLENKRQQRISEIMRMGEKAAPAPVDQEQALFNQLNPQPAAPATAPTTNALVPQAQDNNALRNRINALYMMGEDKLAASLERQIPEPVKAPTETDLAKLIREQQNYIKGSPEWNAYQGKINELSGGMTEYQKQQLALQRQQEERLAKAAEAKADAPTDSDPKVGKAFLSSINWKADEKGGESDDVSALIRKSTSGGLETFGAGAMRFFDKTTEGMKALSALKTRAADLTLKLLGGKLGSGVSNADREFMQQKTADIGNSSLTAEERLSAWNDLVNRMKTIAGVAPAAPMPGGAGAGAGTNVANPYANLSNEQLLQQLSSPQGVR